jgi:hypothetical protein
MESNNKTKNKNVTIIKEKNDIKNLYQKFSKFSKKELKQITIKKSKELIDINKKKEEAKNNLNIIVQKLNELIQSNSRILNIGEPDPEIIEKLEKILEIRKRDLVFSVKLKENYKKQYEKINKKMINLSNQDNLNHYENEISNLRKENAKINYKLKSLKKNNIENEKKIKTLKDSKKYSEKIKSFTEEIKNLGERKDDFCLKLDSVKKNIENIIKEKEILLKLYKSNIKEISNEESLSKINFWLNLIKSDLEGTEEQIIEKVELNKSKIIKEIDKKNKNNKRNIILPLLTTNLQTERSKSINSKLENDNNNISMPQTARYNKYIGIFSKYSFLKRNESQPEKLRSDNDKNVFLTEPDKNNNNDDIKLDYETTNEEDFKGLVDKKNEYLKRINVLKETIKETQKISSQKSKVISDDINDNSNKLYELQQKNFLIQKEIDELEKEYNLKNEQFENKKELYFKEEENNINNNNNGFIKEQKHKRNLSKLSNINDEKEKSIYQSKNEKKIQIEINKSIQNNILKTNKDKGNITHSTKKIFLIREKKLEEIKNKYLEMENDDLIINKDNKNIDEEEDNYQNNINEEKEEEEIENFNEEENEAS